MRHRPATPDDAALDAFLRPRSIAVVGASGDPRTISGLLFHNLAASPFAGEVIPVNRHHPVVQGMKSYPDLAACPVAPDLVIVCVPAPAVAPVVAQAGDLGIGAVCVISAGFAETGARGAALEADVAREAAARGVRLVGPNCAGILAGPPEARFNASFSRAVPRPGRTALISQSGAVGLAVLEAAGARGLGIGAFVSIGNCADVNANDLLLHWGQDAGTDIVLLYLESIQDPPRLARIARDVGRRVPIVAVKAGRTDAGRRGAASHTAALAGGDAAVDALLHQAGIIRAASVEEMLDLAVMLSAHRRFRGRRVAVLTNGGGPGILAADACGANGLDVPELSEPTAARLRPLLPPGASVPNPVDMLPSATAQQFGEAALALGVIPEVDAVFVVYNTPLLTTPAEVATELVAASARLQPGVPLVAAFMHRDGPPPGLADGGVPAYMFPENAARALAKSVTWDERRWRPRGEVRRPDVDVGRVRRLVAEAAARPAGDGWLRAVDAEALVDAYGIRLPRARYVRTEDEARDAQAELGCMVVVKVAAAIHKSDVGGVRLGVVTPAGAAAAVRRIRGDLAAAGVTGAGDELLVQEQVDAGLEMIAGVKRDPVLGPLVMVGWGGMFVEVVGDVAIRLPPLTEGDVDEMLRSLKTFTLLTGYRGARPRDVGALQQVLHALSALAHDVPEIAELDLNPVVVLEHGAVATDVRIRFG